MMSTAQSPNKVLRISTQAEILAIASGKGGVGKTWLSITLAQALSQLGQRVLLFDGDLGLANIDIQLGLNPRRDLGDVLSGKQSLEKVTMSCEPGGFDVIAGRSGSSSLTHAPFEKLEGLTQGLREHSGNYDRVIIDLGAGIERTVRFLAAQAQSCLVVTNDEPTSITDAYAFIKLALRHDPSADLRVVVNMAKSAAEAGRTYATLRKACESFLKAKPPLAGIIRHDERVRDAIRKQIPLMQRHPGSPAAEDVVKLARALTS